MQTRVRGKSNPCASTRTTDEERSQSWPSWALHLSWPGAPPASSLLAGLSKPPLQGSRRWAQGIWQGGIFRLSSRYRALVALVDDIQAICVPSAGRFVVRREGLGCEGGRGWLGEACDDDDDDGEAVSVSWPTVLQRRRRIT